MFREKEIDTRVASRVWVGRGSREEAGGWYYDVVSSGELEKNSIRAARIALNNEISRVRCIAVTPAA